MSICPSVHFRRACFFCELRLNTLASTVATFFQCFDKQKKKSSFALHAFNTPFNIAFLEKPKKSRKLRDSSILRKKRKEKKERKRKNAPWQSKGLQKRKPCKKKRKEKMFHVEQFWGGQKLGKTNKLEAGRVKKI